MASLSLRNIFKIYPGNVRAVSDFNLEVEDKEFVVFVGPSGCGKSTTLRMIAGLEEISDGELYIDNRLVNDVEPKDRDIAMVFQNYALYPHMTVYDNMAFGLRLRRMPSAQIKQRVDEAAEILGIKLLLNRKPKALSGGQRQRVALGRAIVRNPKVFLLDEPLSNLDAKLRVQMRTEITKLHNKLGTTFIYVTHDQTEAMTMGTRIVVMSDGYMQQVDTPQNLYDAPCNKFVATFIGTPQMNLFNARLTRKGKNLVVSFGSSEIYLSEAKSKRLTDESYIGQDILLGVRPEDIHDEDIFIASSPKTIISAVVDVIEKLGSETILYMKIDGKDDYMVARVDARTKVTSGEIVKLAIDTNHIHMFDKDTELAILGVPKYNYFECQVSDRGGALVATFGSNEINFGEGSTSKLTDATVTKALVGIMPDKVGVGKPLPGCERYVVISGTVDVIEETSAYRNVYVRVSGKNGLMGIKVFDEKTVTTEQKAVTQPDGTTRYEDVTNVTTNRVKIEVESKIELYIDTDSANLFDYETGERIISFGKIPKYNTLKSEGIVADGKNGNKVANVKLGSKTYKFETANYSVPIVNSVDISSTGAVYRKEDMSKAAVALKVRVVKLDKIGKIVVLFANLDGEPVVFRMDESFNAIENSTVKLGILPEAIMFK